MKIALINSNLVSLRADLFTTGIVYMPIGMVYLATALARRHEVQVIDSFGEAPLRVREENGFVFSGLPPEEVLAQIAPVTDVIILYADRLLYHLSLVAFIRKIKEAFPKKPLVIFENTQAVTAYSIRELKDEFFRLGVDYLLFGEPEVRASQLVEALSGGRRPDNIPGLASRGDSCFLENNGEVEAEPLDNLPFPDWSLIPVKNYWDLHYAHGPLETGRYLPLLTSRGCPFPCRFCVIPAMSQQHWRGRSAKNVVDEIELNLKRFGVREYHIEDVNPTISDERTREICREIIRRQLPVIWKLASGTKVETIKDEETVALMRQAGCRYISISPESGSKRVMQEINKPFDFKHALKMIRAMRREGIRTQACFILGFPGEEEGDLRETRRAAKELAKAGLDEITLPIVTPVPGSRIFRQFNGFKNYSQLNFSPTWRNDYRFLNAVRRSLYARFLLWKFQYQGLSTFRHLLNFLGRRFETKLEMTPYRVLKTRLALRG